MYKKFRENIEIPCLVFRTSEPCNAILMSSTSGMNFFCVKTRASLLNRQGYKSRAIQLARKSGI